MHSSSKTKLRALERKSSKARAAEKGILLDRKIEALNEATNAMVDLDPRLDSMDHMAICVMLRKLCAPSRVNEILCSSIDDHVTVDDYAKKLPDTKDVGHSTHQLLITMKGSKGAQWSAKPALSFMIDAFHYTEEVIKKYGRRSRMLAEWYEANPQKLYLLPELECLRGKMLSRSDLAKIMYLTDTPEKKGSEPGVEEVFRVLINCRFKAPNPNSHNALGRISSRKLIDFLPWADAEKYLLKQVHQAMANCRRVTQINHYKGDLSKMLFLFDREELPYLPFAINDQTIRLRIKRTEGKKHYKRPTLFEKLRITMPVSGRIQFAEMDTHDPRRWLTTMALRHGEKLSDVLINKWANRSALAQLKAYDFRTDEELAAFSRMPVIPELKDLSGGLEQVRKLEDTYGLKTEIVAVHDAGISVTSLDRVLEAVEDRPIAKTSEQIIILYPTRYGACLHQHHETPCRRYDPCLTCDNNCCAKGHLPTNDAIRKDATLVVTSVVRQLQTLVPALNRGIADHPDTFMEHLTMLVGRGLCPAQMADHLIEEFHDIKDQIKDKLLRKRLEEAFVARGYVRMLDDDSVPNGALMKYHNPKQHAAPGLEMALDTHGGREKVASDEQALIAKFPVFAPTALGLQDERHLIEPDDDEEGD
jgi:hypothetical protein